MADCLRSQGAGGGAAPLLPGPGERGNSTSSSSAPVNTPSRILAHCRGLDPEKVHRGGLPLTVGKEGNTLATRAPLNTYDFPWQIDEQLAVKKRGSRTVVVVKMMVDTRTPPPPLPLLAGCAVPQLCVAPSCLYISEHNYTGLSLSVASLPLPEDVLNQKRVPG